MDFHNFFGGFGLCYGGHKYKVSMMRKGRAPVRYKLCPACRDYRGTKHSAEWSKGYLEGYSDCLRKMKGADNVRYS